MFVQVCLCVCVLPQGACSLIEFFSHRSVWQVALLDSSVCSVQVLSWVRCCHIHLHKGTIPQPPLSLNKTTFHLLPKTYLFQSFTISPSLSAACRNILHSLLCAQITPTKHQYAVKFIGESSTGRYWNLLKNNWHWCISPRWCLEDILAFTFDHKHKRTKEPTMHYIVCWKELCGDLFVWRSTLRELSQQGEVIFCAFSLAVEQCGEKMSFFPAWTIKHDTIGK